MTQGIFEKRKKSDCLTSVHKDNLVMQLNPRQTANFKTENQKANSFLSTSWKGSQANGMTLVEGNKSLNENQQKKFNPQIESEKHGCLTLALGRAGSSDEYMDSVSKIAKIQGNIRRLTPRECARLQTVKEDKIEIILNCGVSDTQLYKAFGNGWTIDVIAYIFSFLPKEYFKN